MSAWTSCTQRLDLWVKSIREGFVALLPLTMLGALASACVYGINANLSAWVLTTFGLDWTAVASHLVTLTMGVMGLASACSIAMRVCVRIEKHELPGLYAVSVGIIAGTAFMLLVIPHNPNDPFNIGYGRIFDGIVIGVMVGELVPFLLRYIPRLDNLGSLAAGVPMSLAMRLSELLIIILPIMAAAHWMYLSAGTWLLELVSPIALSSMRWLHPTPEVLNVGLVLVNQLLWSVGVNGGQVLLHLGTEGSSYIAPANVAYSSTAATPMFVNAFAHMGGAGATWGLILACLLKGKDPNLRKLCWYSVLPAVLNVNELLLFGIPLVFGMRLIVPFILAPTANVLLAVCAVKFFGMTLDGQVIWSTPILLSGYDLTQSWAGVAVQALGLGMSTLIYWPFMQQFEKHRRDQLRDLMKSTLDILIQPEHNAAIVLSRPDQVGDVARQLLADFRNDLGGPRVYLSYQPQHNASGSVAGVEALLRWDHAHYGPIPIAAIINLAEECDLIHHIGKWTLNRACRDAMTWRGAGHENIRVSVNMSPLQLDDPTWVSVVASALNQTRLDPSELELEITEGRTVPSSPQAYLTLAGLQRIGVALSMDDFSMGCTSLMYIQRFRMHAIKLDGNLTREVMLNPVNQDIVRAVSRLGRAQNMMVVAEYVETETQRAMLAELGCDMFQGWLYSKAIPFGELLTYLERHKPGSVSMETSERANLHPYGNWMAVPEGIATKAPQQTQQPQPIKDAVATT